LYRKITKQGIKHITKTSWTSKKSR